MNLVENSVDSTLKREGRLSDVLPDLRGDTNLNEYLDWHQRQNTRLVRNMVELANGQLFAELRAIGERYTLAETSKFGKTYHTLLVQLKTHSIPILKLLWNLAEN